MKFFKKAACIIASAIAAAAAATAICAGVSATELIDTRAQNLYRLYMVTEPETPEAGEDFTLKIMADTYGSTSIGALKYRIEFSTGNYEYKRDENAAFNPLIDDSRANRNGYIVYNYAGGAQAIKGREQEIISFTFNVKNPAGEIRFGTTDRLAQDDSGSDITSQGNWLNITWDECKHEEYYVQTTKEPTCTEEGLASYVCRKCRVSFNSAPIPALGHEWDRTKAVYISAPTCTAGGSISLPCSHTGCTARQTEAIPAMGHNWGNWTVTKTATAYEEGEETRTCSRCNVKETRAIPRNSSITTTPSSTTTTTGNQVSILPTQLMDVGNGVLLQFRAGTIDSWTTLVVKKGEQTATSAKYDITLLRNGVTVQPNDTLYITIYTPSNLTGSAFYVYRVEENGGYTDMGATYSNNAVNFKTGHLSEYIISTVRLIETDALGTTGGTVTNPPATSPPTTTPTPTTAPTPTSPSAIQFETTTTVPAPVTTPPASGSNNTTAPPDVIWDGTTPPPTTAGTGNTGNVNTTPDDNSPDKNVPTGILAVSIPLIAAAIGIFVAKKR